MSALRKVIVSEDKCMGCQACTAACPAGRITVTEERAVRVVRFPTTCSEECIRCADACSERAIGFSSTDEAAEGFLSIEFPLARCSDCGAPYAPARMLDKLRGLLSETLDPVDPSWTETCLDCRRKSAAVQLQRGSLTT